MENINHSKFFLNQDGKNEWKKDLNEDKKEEKESSKNTKNKLPEAIGIRKGLQKKIKRIEGRKEKYNKSKKRKVKEVEWM